METDTHYAVHSENGAIDLRPLLRVIVKRAGLLLVLSLAGGMLATAIAFLIPNQYTAEAQILPPAKPQPFAAALAGQLSGAAGLGSALAPSLGLKDPGDMYVGILKSRSVTDVIIKQFQLETVYRVKTKDDARKALSAHSNFLSGKDSIIRIYIEDRDPRRSAEMANAYIAELQRQNDRLAITESAQRRVFFEREVEQEKNLLAEAENALRDRQTQNGVVEVNSQAQVVIASIAQLRAEITLGEVELQRLKMGATPQNPEVGQQETKLTALRSELSKLEGRADHRRVGDPLIPVANVPQAGLDHIRALRDLKYHEALFDVLAKQYAAARIDEAKEAPVIQVIDYATPPQRKSGPHRSIFAALGTLLSAFLGVIYIKMREASTTSAATPKS